MSQHDVAELLKWPDPLPADWQVKETAPDSGWRQAFDVTQAGKPRGRVLVSNVVGSFLEAAYPAGLRDQVVQIGDNTQPGALQLVAEYIMAHDPLCRRIVLGVSEGDLATIHTAEQAGFRYVVDVDIPGKALSLLVAEPEWVVKESVNLDEVPTD